VRGKGTKRGKGSKLGEGAFRDFGICVYVWDYYEFWACYIRENYVAPTNVIKFFVRNLLIFVLS
jgi:hypothetical protein